MHFKHLIYLTSMAILEGVNLTSMSDLWEDAGGSWKKPMEAQGEHPKSRQKVTQTTRKLEPSRCHVTGITSALNDSLNSNVQNKQHV